MLFQDNQIAKFHILENTFIIQKIRKIEKIVAS